MSSGKNEIEGPLGRIPAGALAKIIPVAEMPRRAFLSQLAALPLVGGALTLVGQPKAVAEPVTPELLDSYLSWLAIEYTELHHELRPGHKFWFGFNPNNGGAAFHQAFREVSTSRCPASSRAALVLSTIGCDWRENPYG